MGKLLLPEKCEIAIGTNQGQTYIEKKKLVPIRSFDCEGLI
jgi:hypothetical protein